MSLDTGTSRVGCSQNGGRQICSVQPENFMTFAGLSIPIITSQDQVVHDIIVSVLTASVVLVCLRFWDEMAKRNVFDQVFLHIPLKSLSFL